MKQDSCRKWHPLIFRGKAFWSAKPRFPTIHNPQPSISVSLLLFLKKINPKNHQGELVLQEATAQLSSLQRERKAGIQLPTEEENSIKKLDRSSTKGQILQHCCPAEWGRNPRKGSLEDLHVASTTGTGNQWGTTSHGSRSAFHLYQHTLSMHLAWMLVGVGLKERILSCPCRGVGLT